MIKALLVGVSKYFLSCGDLPLCINDINVMKDAFVIGLAAKEENIVLLGEKKTVFQEEFKTTMADLVTDLNEEDTFIFYFSGHGTKTNKGSGIVFSDGIVSLNELIMDIGRFNCRNKILMIDSCHSGNKDISLNSEISLIESADEFVGRGCAIMTSADYDELSGFDEARKISIFTSFLYDALTDPYLVRRGKKSLEDIKEYVDRCVCSADKAGINKQHSSFRSSIVGTIYFDVEEYVPYRTERIDKENEWYRIYSVDPVHSNVKRVSISIILE